MIVTIDGPAGAGKSTVARRLASRIGYVFLDTGALYRLVTLAALSKNIDPNDNNRIEELLKEISIDLEDGKAILNGSDVSKEIRSPEVSREISRYAANPAIRESVTARTRQLGAQRNIVTEGRDQGTVVFPNAEVKIFLTADDKERARRRFEELQAKGVSITFEEILADQDRRDKQDSTRDISPLVPAPDATEIDCSNLSIDEVVTEIEALVLRREDGSVPEEDAV